MMEQIRTIDEIGHSHFLIHKPYGMLSQFKLMNNRKKRLLGELFQFPEGTMAVGRLDEASEGLLLLTTNGKLSNYINSNKIDKEYYAQVDGVITEEAVKQLKEGVELSYSGKIYKTKKCGAEKIDDPNFPQRARFIRGDHHGPTSWVSITLRESKFRQVRKMTAKVGFPTLRLVRVRIGNIQIGNLSSGEVKKMKIEEILENYTS